MSFLNNKSNNIINFNNDNNNYIIKEDEIKTIQILKLLFCIMVVFIHSYNSKISFLDEEVILKVPKLLEILKYIISQIICRCAVPGYFLLSSILLYKKDFLWKDNMKKKFKTLIIPYIIVNTLWIAIFYIAQYNEIIKNYFYSVNGDVNSWNVLVWVNAYIGYNNNPFLYPLWFIRDLIILNILSKIIKFFLDKIHKVFIFAIIAILYLINTKINFSILSIKALAFFVIGYYVVKYNIHITNIKKIDSKKIFVMYVIVIFLDYITRNSLINSIINIFSILGGVVFFSKCAYLLRNNSIIKISKYGFGIYLFHEMNLTVLTRIIIKNCSSNIVIQILCYFIIPILIIMYCILLLKILERFLPRLYNILTGNRKY